MNWKNEAMDRLRQYDSARCAVQSLSGELTRIRAMLESPGTARTDLPRSGKSREDWMLSQMVLLRELEQRREQTEQWLDATDRALSALSPEDKLILHRFFISPQKGNADRLCGELGAEKSSVYRRRDAALQRFTLALYGPM